MRSSNRRDRWRPRDDQERRVDLGRRDDRRRGVHRPRRDFHERSPSAQPADAGRRGPLRRAIELAFGNTYRPRRQLRRRIGDLAGHLDRRLRNGRRRRGRDSRCCAAQHRRRPSGPRNRLGMPMRPAFPHRRPLRILPQSGRGEGRGARGERRWPLRNLPCNKTRAHRRTTCERTAPPVFVPRPSPLAPRP